MNNLAPMKNCSGVQGNLNWMPGYIGENTEASKYVMDSGDNRSTMRLV